MKRKLPKGWHRGKPRAKKPTVYAVSRESWLEQFGKLIGNGYALWSGQGWHPYKGWGNYIGCSDMIWSKGVPS